MIALVSRWFWRREAALSDAGADDAAAIAALHAASFGRGWSEGEVESLLVDSAVVADRAMIGRRLVGFILTRHAADEAEVLSIAVDGRARRRGLGRRLLRRNLQRLATFGVGRVFLEVDAGNEPALALYRRMGFVEAGRREGYYRGTAGQVAPALVLCRTLD
jgi:ribosomal-protein-alanine N-acetyltransferase